MNSSVPGIKDLLNPTLDAIRVLGGSGSNGEIRDKVIELLALPAEVLDVPQKGSGSKSEFDYRLPWARTHLKKAGLITNSRTGVWSLTPAGISTGRVDSEEVLKRTARPSVGQIDRGVEDPSDEGGDSVWRKELSETLAGMAPDAFERLCQRLLRECRFSEVEVTGRAGDGGIDGHGIIRLAGLISFPVMFQCKRYKTAVGPGVVRDFRGAMVGRSDRGLILTTSTFSHEARKEATRVHPPIDLIDGDSLANLLKERNLGVVTLKKEVEEVTVQNGFFGSI